MIMGGGGGEDNPNSMMIRETMSQAHHAEFNIQKEREFEKIQQQLYQEFSVLDKNGDGMVTLEEVVHFLQTKVKFKALFEVLSNDHKYRHRPRPTQSKRPE